MITTQCHIHYLCNFVRTDRVFRSFIIKDNLLLSRTDSQYASLRWINNSRETVNIIHAHVRNSECTSIEFIWFQLLLPSSSSQVLNFACYLLKTLQVGSFDNWCHQAMLCLHSDIHIDILVLSNYCLVITFLLPRTVGLRNFH
jgi:hypothetical protein